MTLRVGDRGENVRKVQRVLTAMGFAVAETGRFGPDMLEAVKAYQRANGLPADGVVGKDTLEALSLDPETLEDLIEIEPAADDQIDIEPMDIGIERPADIIASFVSEVERYHRYFTDSARAALDRFRNFVTSASSKEIRSDVWNKVLDKLLSAAVDDILSGAAKHTGIAASLKYIKKAVEAASAEEERAAAAAQSVRLRDWVEKRRAEIQARARSLDTAALRQRLADGLNEAADPNSLLRALKAETAALSRQSVVEGDGRVENAVVLGLYEQWLNDHFTGAAAAKAGFVDIVYARYGTVNGQPAYRIHTKVRGPYGAQLEDDLRGLLADNNARPDGAKFRADLRGAFDLRVHKRLTVTDEEAAVIILQDADLPLIGDAARRILRDRGAWFDPSGRQMTEPASADGKIAVREVAESERTVPAVM